MAAYSIGEADGREAVRLAAAADFPVVAALAGGAVDFQAAAAALAAAAREGAGNLCTREPFPNICTTTKLSRRFVMPNTRPPAKSASASATNTLTTPSPPRRRNSCAWA